MRITVQRNAQEKTNIEENNEQNKKRNTISQRKRKQGYATHRQRPSEERGLQQGDKQFLWKQATVYGDGTAERGKVRTHTAARD
jgi:hypothetical protein